MIDSISGALPAALRTENEEGKPAATREQTGGAAVHAAHREAAEAATRSDAPPTGDVDSEVWDQLNAAERDYFARAELLGRVTYGRGPDSTASAPASRGTQLDLRG